MIKVLAENNQISLDTPYEELPEEFKEKLLYGTEEILTFLLKVSLQMMSALTMLHLKGLFQIWRDVWQIQHLILYGKKFKNM